MRKYYLNEAHKRLVERRKAAMAAQPRVTLEEALAQYDRVCWRQKLGIERRPEGPVFRLRSQDPEYRPYPPPSGTPLLFIRVREIFWDFSEPPPALAPACVGGIVAGMKATFIALLALCFCLTLTGADKKKPGTVLWEFKTGGLVDSSPAIGSDGTVYVGSRNKKLYAIKTASKGLAKSPWPMRGQNARHTGRVMKK